MPDAPDIVLCSKLCRHNPTDPTARGFEFGSVNKISVQSGTRELYFLLTSLCLKQNDWAIEQPLFHIWVFSGGKIFRYFKPAGDKSKYQLLSKPHFSRSKEHRANTCVKIMYRMLRVNFLLGFRILKQFNSY